MKKALAVLAGVVAVGIMLPALAATKNVSLKNIAYNPSTVTVKVGDKVVWTNDEDVPHSVTADDNSFDSSPTCSPSATSTCMMKNDKFPFTFAKAGTFVYFCRVHCANNGCAQGGMRGKVIVQAASTPVPTHHATPTPAPRHTVTPTTAPVAHATPKPTVTPSASPTPTASISPSAEVSPTGSPVSSPIAFGSTQNSNRGPLIGIAVAAVLLAAGGGLLLWFRTRGMTP